MDENGFLGRVLEKWRFEFIRKKRDNFYRVSKKIDRSRECGNS